MVGCDGTWNICMCVYKYMYLYMYVCIYNTMYVRIEDMRPRKRVLLQMRSLQSTKLCACMFLTRCRRLVCLQRGRGLVFLELNKHFRDRVHVVATTGTLCLWPTPALLRSRMAATHKSVAVTVTVTRVVESKWTHLSRLWIRLREGSRSRYLHSIILFTYLSWVIFHARHACRCQ